MKDMYETHKHIYIYIYETNLNMYNTYAIIYLLTCNILLPVILRLIEIIAIT